ncbi:MAG: PglZ domain-containing protein [Chloroflexota bacterium]|nr:PglZ domain-containing protein [Chloroflexota bacterium]
MLTSDERDQVLAQLLLRAAWNHDTALVEDRTGLLGDREGRHVDVGSQRWYVVTAHSLLALRHTLWQEAPKKVALIVEPGAHPQGLRDLTERAPRVRAGAADIIKVLKDVAFPSDECLDPLCEELLDSPHWDLLEDQRIPREHLAAAALTLLLGKRLPTDDGPDHALAAILQSDASIPEAAHPLCRAYAEDLAYGEPFIDGLLTWRAERSSVARALLESALNREQGKASIDPLATGFLEDIGRNDDEALSSVADLLQEALLSDREWGRRWVKQVQVPAPAFSDKEGGVPQTRYWRVLPVWLRGDIRRQLKELASGDRGAVDARRWRQHLRYPDYRDWVEAAQAAAHVVQGIGAIEELSLEELTASQAVSAYVDTIAGYDVAWFDARRAMRDVVELQDIVAPLCARYVAARTELNRAFAERYTQEYERLFSSQEETVVVQILNRHIKPALREGERVLLVVVDGLSYPLWRRFADHLRGDGWQIGDGHALAMLPTVTTVSRYGIFSGPVAEAIYPKLAEPEDETPSPREPRALEEALPSYKTVLYRKADLLHNQSQVAAAIAGDSHDLVAVVINEIDDAIQVHAGTPVGLELDDCSYLRSVLQTARDSGRRVLLTADHGFTPNTGEKHDMPEGAQQHAARLIDQSDTQLPAGVPAVPCSGLVYDELGPFWALYDFGGRWSWHPSVGYHGGVSLEECVVPCSWLRVGKEEETVHLEFLGLPKEVIEDEPLTVRLALQAHATIESLQVTMQFPGGREERHQVDLAPGESSRTFEYPWSPELSEAEATEVVLYAECHRGSKPLAEVRHRLLVKPRPGKYTSAVGDMLP